jgi:hypothetical protein
MALRKRSRGVTAQPILTINAGSSSIWAAVFAATGDAASQIGRPRQR